MNLLEKYLKKMAEPENAAGVNCKDSICRESVDKIDNIADTSPVEVASGKAITEPTSSKPYWQRPDGSCYACHGRDYWLSVYSVMVCIRCHPPAHDGLVARWGNA